MIVKKSDFDVLVAYACCNVSGLPCTKCPLNKGRAVRCAGVMNRQAAEALKTMRRGI
jgi:hypothetical protein